MGWQVENILANLIEIIGANGGLFLYDASGNLIASVTSATADPKGNPTKPIITVYGTGGNTSFITLDAGNPAVVQVGTGDSAEATPGEITGIVSGSGATRTLIHDLRAAVLTGQNALEKAEVQLISPSEDLATSRATALLIAQSASSSTVVTLTPTEALIAATLTHITGQLTSGGGNEANPTLITTDTWNTLGLLAGGSGYTVNNGRYQLDNNGFMMVDVNLTAGAATVQGNYTFANALPAGFRPPFQCSYDLGFNGTTAAGVDTAAVRISTAGAVSLQLPVLPNGTVATATIRVPTN